METKKGFTLVETIVSIALLTLAITGPLSVATFALRSSSISENEIVAYNLVEEGLEYIKNKIDTNTFTSGAQWRDGLSECESGNGCDIDAISWAIISCPGGICPVLRRSSLTGLYTHAAASADNTDTIFTRRILLDNVPGAGNDEQELAVTISWPERDSTHSFTITSHVFKRR
ncbi:prepilin-type N-terminal cleavage/methylation domain-containing protein [Candidatus Giovannonibacteria bacterium]|nr:prepilin-type N-terminal cleavage/methylation domain-containing protein [Candidatus Giovannonibacteria bacterium]